MSIASELNIERQLIENAYDKIDDLGVDLTDVDKNIDNIAEMLEDVWQEYPKVTATGTEVTLEGTKAGKMKLDIKGNSTQETTEGTQLIEPRMTTATNNGIKCTNNGDGSFTLNGTASALATFRINQTNFDGTDNLQNYNGTYTLSGAVTGISVRLMTNGDFVTYINNNTAGGSATATINVTNAFIFLLVSNGTTLNNVKIYPMFNTGNTAKPFEQYTGGLPSPNPSYPQPINSAGDNVNLFDKTTITENARLQSSGTLYRDINYFATDYIPVKANTIYTANSDFLNLYNRICYYNENKVIISANDGHDINYFITPTGTKFVRFAKANNQLNTFKLVEGINTGGYSAYGIGCITEKIVNKNLFNPNTALTKKYVMKSNGDISTSNGWSASDFIQVKPDTQYIYSGVTNSWSDAAGTAFYDETKTFISSVNSITQSFTTPSNAKYVRISVQTETPNEIQLEQDSTATSYVAHAEQTFTIPTQQPMRKIGDAEDIFIKENGIWYERHLIKRRIFDGTETWYRYSYGTTRTVMEVININDIETYSSATTNPQMLSNYFISISQSATWKMGDMSRRTQESTHLYLTMGSGYTIETFQAWLAEKYASGNPVYVDYVLAEPTNLPCTLEQTQALEALAKAKGYDNVVHVFSTDVTPANLSVEAMKGA